MVLVLVVSIYLMQFDSFCPLSVLLLSFLVLVAECIHRHHIETTCTLLISSFVPSHFWGEVVSTVYLINRQPSSKLSSKCVGEVLFGIPPSYYHLQVFGCTCYVLLAPRERTKLT